MGIVRALFATSPGLGHVFPTISLAHALRAAGHADIRTTTIYAAVNPGRLEHAIAERGRQNRGAHRAAASA